MGSPCMLRPCAALPAQLFAGRCHSRPSADVPSALNDATPFFRQNATGTQELRAEVWSYEVGWTHESLVNNIAYNSIANIESLHCAQQLFVKETDLFDNRENRCGVPSFIIPDVGSPRGICI